MSTTGTRPHRRIRAMAVVLGVFAAGCSGGSGGSETASSTATTATGSAPPGEISLALESTAGGLALGDPIEVTMTATNSGAKSEAAPVQFSLTTPEGGEIAFYRTSLFVPAGQSASETITLTTTRWTAATGAFAIGAALVDDSGDGAVLASTATSLPFEIGPATRVIPTFTDATEAAGLSTQVPEPICGQFANGAAWGDVDGDGSLDLVVTRLGDPVQLFVNQGDGAFIDESAARGVTTAGVNGATFADYDNDGDADLVLVGDGPDALLDNDGTGHFTDVTARAGIAGDPSSRGMSASWGDYDGDGLLDLYVTNYMECTGEWTTEAEIVANVAYFTDVLYRNEGDGTFLDVTDTLPDPDETGAGFTAAWFDANADLRPDLYVANDFVGISPEPNRLWINAGDGGGQATFVDTSLESGAGLYLNTMGVGIGDIDRDGDLDMALSNIGGNKLIRGNGDGTFVEETGTGIERPMQGIDYPTITWGTVFGDFDLDGWEDIFMAAGNLPRAEDAVVGDQANMLFLNDGTGQHFLDVSALTGADDVSESKGVAVADYDQDGDLDLFVVNQNGSPRLYRNDTPRDDRHWLMVDPIGTVSNRDSCGARVTVTAGAETFVRPVLCSAGASGSGHQRQAHVGLGALTAVDAVTVTWPSGLERTITDVAVDATLTVEEPQA